MTLLLSAAMLVLGAIQAQAQYERTVLLEEFTSATCKPCTTATQVINKVIREKQGRVVSIRYHMNIPLDGDIWYEANKPHNTGRAKYYGEFGLPYGRVDGAINASVTSEGDVFDKVEDQMGQQSPIKLEVTQTRDGNQFNIAVKATAGSQGLANGYKIHVVAVEAHIHDERFQGGKWNNEKDFEDVMRTLVTGTDGQEFTVDADAQKTLNFNYQLGEGWQPEQMYTVVFVQNDFNLQIAQAGYSPKPVSGVEWSTEVEGYTLRSNYPNPSRGEALIGYTLGTSGAVKLELHDAVGRLVATYDEGTRSAGEHHLRIDLSNMPAGNYTYTLYSGRYRASRTMIVLK